MVKVNFRQHESGYDCKEVSDLLLLYVLNRGDLSLVERDHVGSHLENCASCRGEYEQAKYVNDVLIANRDYFVQESVIGRPRSETELSPLSDEEVDFLQFQGKLERAFARRKRAERRARWERLRPVVKVASAAAACMVIGLWIFWAASQPNGTSDEPRPVASSRQQDLVKIELISRDHVEILSADQPVVAINKPKTLRINGNRQMIMNSGTKLSIQPYNLGCIVKLDKGEIYVEVEHDGKLFVVETVHGRAVITGTTFNIKTDENRMELGVLKGSVRLESEHGNVNVQGGYQSLVAIGNKPVEPLPFDITHLAGWAKEQSTEAPASVIRQDFGLAEMPELISLSLPYQNLEDIDFVVWIEQHREWFEREFPWTKRLQKLLTEKGVEADTIVLLIESGQLWQFTWPEHSRIQMLPEDSSIIHSIADKYGIEIDQLISIQSTQKKQVFGEEEVQRWLDVFGGSNGDLTIGAIHAATFLLNTRSLAWYAIRTSRIQFQDNGKVLDLLARQVKVLTKTLETLNQMLLADMTQSSCSELQYDVFIETLKKCIAAIIENEKELAGYEVVGK